MRLGRIESGIARYYTKDDSIARYFNASYGKGLCGCRILSISIFYFTWKGNECYLDSPENEEK